MLQLSTEDRGLLLALLEKLPDLDTEDERRNAIIDAGLEPLLPMLDLEGAPHLVLGRIVDRAAHHGPIGGRDGKEALVLLCVWAKAIVGVEQQAQIDEILGRCKPGEPVHTPVTPREPDPPDRPDSPWSNRRLVFAAVAGGVLVAAVVVVFSVRSCSPEPASPDAASSRPDAVQPDASPPDASPPDAPPDAARPARPDAGPIGPGPVRRGRCFLDLNGVKPEPACPRPLTQCRPLEPDERTNPDWALCAYRCTCP